MYKAEPVELEPDDGGNTIRVVANRTGFTQETLRAWERRYGFPRPERREGSNRRLYSAADLARLVAIRRTLDRGYRVGDVIGKSMPELEGLAEPTQPAPPAAASSVAHLLDLLANDRIAQLEAELRRSAAALGPRRFVTEVAHPLAVSVGDAWAEGRLSVRHEHLATECLITQLRHMLAGYQDIEARPLVLLATPPTELHTLPLEMVATYLVVGGARPRLLGGPTPTADVLDATRVLGADTVGLTVSPGADRREVRKAVKALRRGLPSHVPLWIGGGGARALRVEGEGIRVVSSWEGIDEAVAAWRRASR